MIKVDQITFSYNTSTPLFEAFSWHAGRGETWALLGVSGCGKTTLLYLLAGLLLPESGVIRVDDQPVTRPRPETGLILQDFGLLPWATVYQNALLGLQIREFYGPDGKHAPADPSDGNHQQRVEHWLQRLGLSSVRDQYPGQLSGGQRQRTAIARTLAMQPDLLLMDEPFAALDAPTRESLQQVVRSIGQERSLTTVLVTHSIEEAMFVGEKILLLTGKPNREPLIYDNPSAGQHASEAGLGFAALQAEIRERLMEQWS